VEVPLRIGYVFSIFLLLRFAGRVIPRGPHSFTFRCSHLVVLSPPVSFPRILSAKTSPSLFSIVESSFSYASQFFLHQGPSYLAIASPVPRSFPQLSVTDVLSPTRTPSFSEILGEVQGWTSLFWWAPCFFYRFPEACPRCRSAPPHFCLKFLIKIFNTSGWENSLNLNGFCFVPLITYFFFISRCVFSSFFEVNPSAPPNPRF